MFAMNWVGLGTVARYKTGVKWPYAKSMSMGAFLHRTIVGVLLVLILIGDLAISSVRGNDTEVLREC